MIYDRKWELIDGFTERMEVPLGWLVRSYNIEDETVAITYVPDPQHEWKLTTEKE